MSNLKTARKAIQAELKYVEEGVAYYQKRSAALRAALEQLESSEDPVVATTQKEKVTRKSGKRTMQTDTRKASSKNVLPKTSRDFWLGFIDQSPKTAAEIGNAAVASLGFTPTSEQAKQLKSRLAPTLQALLKSKAVKDTGSGRERKYSLGSSGTIAATKGKAKPTATSANVAGSANGNAVHH